MVTTRVLPLLLVLVACGPSRKVLVLSNEMRRPAATAKTPASDSKRYVVRVAEGGRLWELELPESSAYELRIPLAAGRPPELNTAADQELAKAATPNGAALDAKAFAAQKSYLGTRAKIGELYAARKYELALIELVDLEKAHPNDAQLLAMKGSLYQKLRKPALAKQAWERALRLDPGDVHTAEALQALVAEGEAP
jgi:tetratricopeptide (TPR) repeat protein